MQHPATADWYQGALGSLPDLQRLLPKAVALLSRFQRWGSYRPQTHQNPVIKTLILYEDGSSTGQSRVAVRCGMSLSGIGNLSHSLTISSI